MVTTVTELSGSYFDLDDGSWSSDVRGAENFDRRSAERSVLLACEDALLIDAHQTTQRSHIQGSKHPRRLKDICS
jgi:hypothetical protein